MSAKKLRAKVKKSLKSGEAGDEKMECKESKMFYFIFWFNYACITQGNTWHTKDPKKYCL